MTDRELMQMALDAATEELPKVDERETVFCSIQGHHLRVLCEFVRAALAQPEPEPVAWRVIDGEGRINYVSRYKDSAESWLQYDATRRLEPLYTAPPQREPDSIGDLYAHRLAVMLECALDAHRLAVMLECALLDPTSTWNDAHELLDEYRQALRERDEAAGVPYVSGFGKKS